MHSRPQCGQRDQRQPGVSNSAVCESIHVTIQVHLIMDNAA